MNVLIVDDDIMIRNWLTMLMKQVSARELTIFSVGDADAAELCCEQERIDLVITDITMPQRSGLDLLRTLREKHPEIKTACLSAYDDYTYIRKALKLGTLDYILKSEMVLEDVAALLEKVEVFSHMEQSGKLSAEEETTLRERNLRVEAYMDGLDEPLEALCGEIGCKQDDTLAVIAFQLVRGLSAPRQTLKMQMLCDKTIQNELKRGISLTWDDDRILALFVPGSDTVEGREAEGMKIALLFKRNLETYTDQSVTLSIYEMCPERSQLRKTIERAVNLTDAHQYYPDFPPGQALKLLTPGDIGQLKQLLKWERGDGRQRLAIELFRQQLDKWHGEYMVPQEIRGAVILGISILLTQMESTVTSGTYLLNYNFFSRKVRESVHQADLLAAFERFVQEFLLTLKTARMPVNPSVQAAIQYINESYAQKLTLEDVAKHIYLNRTYVSQLFKKQLNVSFVEYLETVRINKAKEMLMNTRLSITHVAERVGYSNQSYFTKVFKRNTGFSPQNYRLLAMTGSVEGRQADR